MSFNIGWSMVFRRQNALEGGYSLVQFIILLMFTKDLEETNCSSNTKLTHKKIVRKQDYSPAKSDRSSSIQSFKYLKVGRPLERSHNPRDSSAHPTIQPELTQKLNGTTSDSLVSENTRLSVSTYQSNFLSHINTHEGVTDHSLINRSLSISKPTYQNGSVRWNNESLRGNNDANRENSDMNGTQQIQLLEKQLEHKTIECFILEADKAKLNKSNEDLRRHRGLLEKEVQNLKVYNDTLNKKLQAQQHFIKRISKLDNEEVAEIRNIQSHREEYLQRELDKLKSLVVEGKSDNEKMLEEELTACRAQLYNALKSAQAIKTANNCLQIKLKETVHANKQVEGTGLSKLKEINKKLVLEVGSLKKAYQSLLGEYNRLDNVLVMDDSLSLEYSNCL